MYHPGIIQHFVNRFSIYNCPICFEDRRNNVTLPCGHILCRKCYRDYIKLSIDPLCHMCRSPIYIFKYSYIFFGFPGGMFLNFCI